MDKTELINQLRIDRSPTPPPRRWRWLLALAAALVLAVGVWRFLAGTTVRSLRTATALPVAAVEAVSSVLDATGYVVARRQATVSAKITGKVREVRIEEGQRVAAGEVLADLDDTDLKAQLALARAQLAAARSQRAELQVQLAQARRDEKRLSELLPRRLTSPQAAEQSASSRRSLQARLAAQDRQILVAEESLRVAQVSLDNTVIRAPFAGVVVAKTAQPGEIVSPMSAGGGFTRTGIGTVVDMDSLEIEVEVNEAFIGRVSPKQPVQARLNAYPDWTIPAEVIAIVPTADRSKATVKVRIAMSTKDPRIVPEMGVRVGFQEVAQPRPAESVAGVAVPETALRRAGEDWVVFVVADGRALQQRVIPAEVRGVNRIIRSGLAAGAKVIVDPPADLDDGAAVAVEP